MGKQRMTIATLFSKIDVHPDGCWIWTGYCRPDGYGEVGWDYRIHRVHRLVYELLVGPIPLGLHLDHLCRVSACVNPGHLEPVTTQENTRRGLKGVLFSGVCPQGHAYTAENTKWKRNRNRGGKGLSRYCAQCNRDRARRRAA